MKRTISLTMIIMVLTLLFSSFISNYSYASTDNITGPIIAHTNEANIEKVTSLGGKIVGVIQAVGTVVAIVMLLVVGITYLTKSPEGKAEYKKSMGNYIIGALLIFGAATLVNMLYSVAKGLGNTN